MSDVTKYEQPSQPSLLNIIAQAARDPATDVAKFEALFRLQREIIGDQQAAAFKRAMSAVQAEMGPVVRDAKNDQTHSRYARLETIDAMLRPIYSKHGFGLSFNSTPLEAGNIRVECEVSHDGGHSKTYCLEAALDTMGAQGKVNKTPLHALGSSVSYLRRYLTTMIFNVTLTNEDDDGNAGNRPAARRETNYDPAPEPKTFAEQATAELENEPNGTKWLNLLGFWLNRCGTMDEVVVVRGLPSFKKANEKAPSLIRGQITDMMRVAVDRLAPQPDAPVPDASLAVEMMFDQVPPKPEPGDILSDINSEVQEITTEEGIKQWAADPVTKDKMATLRQEGPAEFARAIAIIDERRLQLEG